MPLIESDADVAALLRDSQSVAIIGVSSKPDRASHQVAAWMLNNTHLRVYLINPAFEGEILGHKVYPNVASLPEMPDIIDVFRKSEDMPGVYEREFPAVADDAVGRTWWMQLGISNSDVADRADLAGMKVVQNRCIKVDYANLIGG